MPMTNDGSPLTEEITNLVLDEITNDPCSLGYLGKSSSEVADLLNNPRTDAEGLSYPARFYAITVGVAFSPNAIETYEVEGVLNG